MKKKFDIKDLLISVFFCLFLCLYLLPLATEHFLYTNYKVSHESKQEILLAGKLYLQNNPNKEFVYVYDLLNTGYLLKENYNYEDNCFPLISTIKKDSTGYHLYLKCIHYNGKLTLL